MKAVIQRVKSASVSVDGREASRIGQGLAILLGVARGDDIKNVNYLAEKIANLRVFEDEMGKMNLSVLDIGAEALVVSQFTLVADCRKGRRPGFADAAAPEEARKLYEEFVDMLGACGIRVATGVFQTSMLFEINNDGPVTIILDTDELRSNG